jgi:hypothetical protein
MSLLLATAFLAAAASIVAIGCVGYILISFRQSGHLLASRVGHQPLALVMIADRRARRRQPVRARSGVARRSVRWQPLTSAS